MTVNEIQRAIQERTQEVYRKVLVGSPFPTSTFPIGVLRDLCKEGREHLLTGRRGTASRLETIPGNRAGMISFLRRRKEAFEASFFNANAEPEESVAIQGIRTGPDQSPLAFVLRMPLQ